MKTMMRIIFLLAAFVLTVSSTAQDRPKQDGQNDMRKRFEEMRRQQMEQLDKNKDGKIDEEERRAARDQWQRRGAEMRKRFIERYDKNKDGKIDDKERDDMTRNLLKQVEEHVGPINDKRLDADGDGKVTEEEKMNAARQIQDRFARGRVGGGRSWYGSRRQDPADFDGNGRVSDGEKALAEAMLTERFQGVL